MKAFDPGIGKATQWTKGQASPNPGGRPSKTPLSDAYRRLLEKPYPGDQHGRTYVERIAEVVCYETGGGDLAAIREITDRTEGKARQNVEMNPIDLSRLTPEQQLQLARLLAVANGSVETVESATDTPKQL
jgi:Family of unknown function (DUF5681)